MVPKTLWGGTETEKAALLRAMEANCECALGPAGVRVSTCAGHALLLDQTALDHLLYARRLARRLEAEEFRRA